MEQPRGAPGGGRHGALYIDRHLVHEVTSPQAFEGLKLAGRPLWRVDSVVSTADHNTPTDHWDEGIKDPISRQQWKRWMPISRPSARWRISRSGQGPGHRACDRAGQTLPGMTVVCGDSHTSTHGAFAALAHGIGTSEVEHVMATQCLAKKSKNMLVRVDGQLGRGITGKDVALAIIGKIGTAGGTGYAIEFAGAAIESLSMEGRMSLCNMAIEAGARSGMVAVDQKTIDYVKGRPFAPRASSGSERWRIGAVAFRSGRRIRRGSGAARRGHPAAGDLGHFAGDGGGYRRRGAGPGAESDPVKKSGIERALSYMGLQANTPFTISRWTSCSSVPVPIAASSLREAASVAKAATRPPM